MSQEKYVTKTGKFVNVLIPTSKITVSSVKYSTSKQYGTNYRIILSVDDPILSNVDVLLKWSSSYNKSYAMKYNKAAPNVIGMLSDFIGIGHNELKEIIKADPESAKRSIENGLHREDRLIKIDSTVIPKDESETAREMIKVFNIATEAHITVPYSEIRTVVLGNFGKQIVKTDVIPLELRKMDGFNPNVTYETMEKGETVWVTYLTEYTIGTEKFTGFIAIYAGFNTKQSAMRVMVYLKIGSCDNTIRCINIDRIMRVGDCKTRLDGHIRQARDLFADVRVNIQNAMKKNISLSEAEAVIDHMDFGLRDENKIEKVRESIKARITFEFTQNNTQSLWGVSQALTNVGSHPENTESVFDKYEISDGIYSRLQEEGYAILSLPIGH